MATPTERWKQYLAEARTMLRNASGVNTRNGRMNPLGIQNVLDPLGLSSNSPRQGGVRTAYGTTPSEADVVRVATQLSGGWKPGQTRRGAAGGSSGARRTRRGTQRSTGAGDETTALEALKNSFESRINEANKANLDRYNESHGELTDVRTRNQDRVGNWGKAAEADIDERLREAAGNVAANLAARGLGNSNIQGAFELKAAQNAARERQRVSEMRDDRASQYDTRDTNNLVNLIGQRNDIAPDYSLLVNLADRMGQAEALKAFNEQRAAQPSYTPQPYYGVPNYTSPGGAYMRAPQTVNLFAGAMNNLPQFTSRPGIVSNRGVQPRTALEYGTIAANRAESDAVMERNARTKQRRADQLLHAPAFQAGRQPLDSNVLGGYISNMPRAARPSAFDGPIGEVNTGAYIDPNKYSSSWRYF